MENIKTISDLTFSLSINDNQELEINNSGVSEKITLGQLRTFIASNKVDLDGSNATFPHIVESFVSSDGLSWYRKYSDGWIEQGGMIGGSYHNNGNINFLVPFLDTKYIVNFANYTNETGSIINKRNICLNGYSATGISFISSDFPICWEAKGYYQ